MLHLWGAPFMPLLLTGLAAPLVGASYLCHLLDHQVFHMRLSLTLRCSLDPGPWALPK